METTTTSSCKDKYCDKPDCNCDCGDCTEELVAGTCTCTCHLTEPKLF